MTGVTGLPSAIVLAESGGSNICVASVGNDHREGPEDLNIEPVGLRVEAKEYLRGELISEEEVTDVVAVEYVRVEDMLGRGGMMSWFEASGAPVPPACGSADSEK